LVSFGFVTESCGRVFVRFRAPLQIGGGASLKW
jgi:hypothetical protein